jgi:hypothetical protein
MASGSNSLILDFHTLSGSVQDYDGRIRCQNGETGTSQRGDMSYLGKSHTFGTTTADIVHIDTKANMSLGINIPRCRLDARIVDDTGLNPILILDNHSSANNTTKNNIIQFRGTDTVGTSKNIGEIRYLPNDANYLNSSTNIFGRRSDAEIHSVLINHELQEFTFGIGGLTTYNPSIYLNGRTNSGQQGVRIHYNSTTDNSGGARFDLKANIGSQTMRFRADTSNGLTDMMTLSQGGNCRITRELTVGLMTNTGNIDTFHDTNGVLGISTSDIRTKRDVENFENELDELWETIQPIKYFYKTQNANQIDEDGKYRKTYGINASVLHKNIKQINKNVKVQKCEVCQNRTEGGICECEKYETIDCANYCSRDIISLCIAKIKQQDETINDMKNETINSMKNEINIQNETITDMKNEIEQFSETITDMKNEIEQLSDLVQRLSSIFTMGSNMVSPPSTPRRSITPRFTDNNLQKAKESLVNQVVKPSTPSKYFMM